jgi:predicted dehydrogenase
MVVRRARRRDQALGQAHHRRLLYPLADKRDKFAAKYGCRAYPSYEAVLADRTIEAIVNTTPNAAHLETTRAAAEAGKHVFLDKPIANTIADARALTEACRKAKVVLALGYQRRRESHFRWIKQRIQEFGKLVNARPTSAATASARSTSRRGATAPRACRAA